LVSLEKDFRVGHTGGLGPDLWMESRVSVQSPDGRVGRLKEQLPQGPKTLSFDWGPQTWRWLFLNNWGNVSLTGLLVVIHPTIWGVGFDLG
jgi:hypothetical protein